MDQPGSLVLIMAVAVLAPVLAYGISRWLAVPLLVSMPALAQALGLDILLGAFAAGLVTRLVLHGAAPESSATVLSKVEAMGSGFLVPVFFVVTGIEFDLEALLAGGRELLLLPLFLLLFLVVRGLPIRLLAPGYLGGSDRSALVLFGATALPLVVAITTLGVEDGKGARARRGQRVSGSESW